MKERKRRIDNLRPCLGCLLSVASAAVKTASTVCVSVFFVSVSYILRFSYTLVSCRCLISKGAGNGYVFPRF